MVFAFCNFLYSHLSLNQVSLIYLKFFQRYAPDKLTIANVRNGNTSEITCDRVTVLALGTFSDGHLSMYQVSFNSLLYFQRYAPDKLFIAKIKKGSNSVNTGDRIMVFAFCNFLYSHLSLNQVSLIYIKFFQRYAPDKLTVANVRKGNTSEITCDRVTVLALGTFSDGHLSMYQVSFNSLLYFQRYAPDKLFIAKIKKGSNSVNTGDRVMVLAFCNSLKAFVCFIKLPLTLLEIRSG